MRDTTAFWAFGPDVESHVMLCMIPICAEAPCISRRGALHLPPRQGRLSSGLRVTTPSSHTCCNCTVASSSRGALTARVEKQLDQTLTGDASLAVSCHFSTHQGIPNLLKTSPCLRGIKHVEAMDNSHNFRSGLEWLLTELSGYGLEKEDREDALQMFQEAVRGINAAMQPRSTTVAMDHTTAKEMEGVELKIGGRMYAAGRAHDLFVRFDIKSRNFLQAWELQHGLETVRPPRQVPFRLPRVSRPCCAAWSLTVKRRL